MKAVIGLVGEVEADLSEFDASPYKKGRSYDALLVAPGAETPEDLPEWLPVVHEPKELKRALKRWSVTIDEVREVAGPGTVVYGRVANAPLRQGMTAVREGHERSMLIREMRIDGHTVGVAHPGDRVGLAFGRVPVEIFRPGGVLRPGRPTRAERPKAEVNPDIKARILETVGDDPAGRGTAAICKALDRTPQALGDVFESLKREGRLLGFAGQWIKPRAFEEGTERFVAALDTLHAKNPSSPSHTPAKVVAAARLSWSGKPLDRILARMVEKGFISMREEEVRRPAFRVNLGTRQRGLLDRVIALLDEGGVNPPNAHELGKRLPAPPQAVLEILQLGEDSGEIVTLSDGVIFSTQGLRAVKERVRSGASGKPFTLGEMRDALGTSRRVAVALLEQFDDEGFTERRGERRVVRS